MLKTYTVEKALTDGSLVYDVLLDLDGVLIQFAAEDAGRAEELVTALQGTVGADVLNRG